MFVIPSERQRSRGIAAILVAGLLAEDASRDSGIQNGGVDRMSGMSSMLRIHPERPSSSPNQLNENGMAFRDVSLPSGSSLFHSGSLRDGVSR
jgi:hypothetical protein